MRVDKVNGRSVVMVKGKLQKVQRFLSNEFRKNIGCLVLALTFGLGGYMLWDKEEKQKTSEKKVRAVKLG